MRDQVIYKILVGCVAIAAFLVHQGQPRFVCQAQTNGSSPPVDKRLDYLINFLCDSDPDRRAYAVEALGRMTEEAAILSVFGRLGDPDDRVRQKAADVLGSGKVRPQVAIPLLARSLKDPAWEVRATSALSLKTFGARAKDATEQLAGALRDDTYEVRTIAADAIGEIGTSAKKMVESGAKFLDEKRPGWWREIDFTVSLSFGLTVQVAGKSYTATGPFNALTALVQRSFRALLFSAPNFRRSQVSEQECAQKSLD
jgi:hypothetical protein